MLSIGCCIGDVLVAGDPKTFAPLAELPAVVLFDVLPNGEVDAVFVVSPNIIPDF